MSTRRKVGISVLTEAGLLAVLAVAAKVLGALYRVPLTNVLGGEGMGLYQMAYPLFVLFYTLVTGGVSAAVARCIAAGDSCAFSAVVKPLIYLGMIAAAIFALIAYPVATLQGNSAATSTYLSLAPALALSGIVSGLRGYFQGRCKQVTCGVSQLVESSAKLLVGVLLSSYLMRFSVSAAASGAATAVGAGEVAALCFMLIRYKQSPKTARPLFATNAAKNVFKFALPVLIGAAIVPLTQLVESAFILRFPNGNMSATALYGLYSGAVATIVNMPIVILAGVSGVVMPLIAAGREKERAKFYILFTFFAAIAASVALFFFARFAITFLFASSLSSEEIDVAVRLLQLESVSVLFATSMSLCTAVLQGKGKSATPSVNLAIGAAVKIVLLCSVVKNVYGAAAASVTMYAVTALLDLICALRTVKTVPSKGKEKKSASKESALNLVLSKKEMPAANAKPQLLTAAPLQVTEGGAAVESLAAPLQVTESGAAVESLAAPLQVTESGAAVESLAAPLQSTESAVVLDKPYLTAPLQVTEGGAAVESLAVPLEDANNLAVAIAPTPPTAQTEI